MLDSSRIADESIEMTNLRRKLAHPAQRTPAEQPTPSHDRTHGVPCSLESCSNAASLGGGARRQLHLGAVRWTDDRDPRTEVVLRVGRERPGEPRAIEVPRPGISTDLLRERFGEQPGNRATHATPPMCSIAIVSLEPFTIIETAPSSTAERVRRLNRPSRVAP